MIREAMKYGLVSALLAMLMSGCSMLLAKDPPLPRPPPIAVTPPPKPTVVVEQVCIKPDIWVPGEQLQAANALAPIVKANPAAAHLLKEWVRLRADAKACAHAQH